MLVKQLILVIMACLGGLFSSYENRTTPERNNHTDQKVAGLKQDYTKSFPQYGFSITAPCVLEDVSSQSSGNFLLNLGGITDGNDPAKMAAYQLALIRVPVGYKDLPKEEYERMMDCGAIFQAERTQDEGGVKKCIALYSGQLLQSAFGCQLPRGGSLYCLPLRGRRRRKATEGVAPDE